MIKIEKGFKNDKLVLELDIYVIDNSGKAWFKAKDVTDYLGYEATAQATRYLNDPENHSCVSRWHTAQGNEYNATFVDEYALYEMVLRVTKKDNIRYEKAQQFQKWVFGEVLPGLRRNGAFVDVKSGETTDDSIEKCANATLDAHYGATREIERLELALAYEREENSVAKTEIDNLNARNDYLETEHDKLTSDNSRLKKIVKFFLDKDKADFINRNDIKNIPTESNKYKKFLLDVTSRLTRRNPIYKDVRVLDYYDEEEDFYA